MVTEYIKNNWDKCIRYNKEDNGTLIGLPHPYIVPTTDGAFEEMYYWDTFFTCKGLLLTGRTDVVKNCTDNMLYLVNRFGFMPNGNRTYYLSQSQPPFLSMMVKDVYNAEKDKVWLESAYETLKKEYDFWMRERMTPIGLNAFGVNRGNIKNPKSHYESISKRINLHIPTKDYEEFAENMLADCESGWDFNPRTLLKQKENVYVDLNSNLYIYEKNFAEFAGILNNGEQEKWIEAANRRKSLMNKYLWRDNAFYDYNFVTNTASPIFSAASFYPLWAEVADFEQAEKTVELLKLIEFDYGITACCKNDVPGSYQWDYPTGWAPLHYIVIKALENYGFISDAYRIAKKYVSVSEALFESTGCLWEKYNAVVGGLTTGSDYQGHPMLGWSAGVYLYTKDFLLQRIRTKKK